MCCLPRCRMIDYFSLCSLVLFRETSALWISVDVPSAQPPGQYEGEILITAIKTDSG